MNRIVAAAVCVLSFTGCSAFDFGSRAPIEVEVNVVSPTWQNGIGLLMSVKCASCHAGQDPMAPANAPRFQFQNEAVVQAKKDRILARVFNSPAKPMPPAFGTPLTANELAALRKYIAQ